MIRKVFMAATMLVAAVTSASAQNNGLAGINDATKMVTSYFDPGTKLVYAIGAVVGLIGGIKTYNKFSSGDPDTAQDRRIVVRRVHISHCRRDDTSLFFPVIQFKHGLWNTQSIKASAGAWSSGG